MSWKRVIQRGLGVLNAEIKEGVSTSFNASTCVNGVKHTSAEHASFMLQRSMHLSPQPAGHVKAPSGTAEPTTDPLGLVKAEVNIVSERLRHSVSNNIPALKEAAEYFFHPSVLGKRLRPSIIMLMSSALALEPPSTSDLEVDLRPPSEYTPELRRRQQRISEIAEMIHVASLLHDDVLDDASTRRGVSSLNIAMGNKVAILAGDFLLARASVSLAALRDTKIVELLSEVLEHLVSGEIMQMVASGTDLLDLDKYLHKTYCKTASLMANSSRAVAMIAGREQQVCDLAWGYGRHLGLAFQIVDDILDMTATSSMLGKPALNDLKSGLATAPVLFAAREVPELIPLIQRRFKHDDDVANAVAYVARSGGIAAARELAAQHAELASQCIAQLPPTPHAHAMLCRGALIEIAQRVLTRTK